MRYLLATVISVGLGLSLNLLCATSAADVRSNPVPLTVAAVVQTYGKAARTKLRAAFQAADVQYPPKSSTWVALKAEKVLYVFAHDRKGKMRRVLTFPVIGASGSAGPKLKEGDKQVPEGFYKLTRFRPHLVAHIGLEIDYPNAEDRRHAQAQRRHNLGNDILIHGSRWSTGCLAMENEPIEQLFVLAYDSGISSINLIFAPCNLSAKNPTVDFGKQPDWLPALYERLRKALEVLPIPTA